MRPHRARMTVVLSATMLAMLCGLGIPLLTQRIVDGPIQNKETGPLPWLILGVLVLGLGEAALFYIRRKIVARPAAEVEARMRFDLYQHLQRLPVAFHDRWQSGQLLSRAVDDLTTLRRFVAFAIDLPDRQQRGRAGRAGHHRGALAVARWSCRWRAHCR